MAAVLLPQGKQQYFTAAGIPLAGGKVFTYDTGTTTPRTTWADAAQSSPNTNPVILDGRGEGVIFWSGSYRVVLKDSLDNTIWTVDGVADASGALIANLASYVSGSLGAGMVGFGPSLTYTANSVGSFLASIYGRTDAEVTAGVTPTAYQYPPLNLLRYGGDPTGTDDNGAAFTALVQVLAASQGGSAIIPPGEYLFSTQPLITGNFTGNCAIWAYGAEFYSTGNIFGLHISYNGTPHLLTVYGLTINHRGNATADGGFDLSACNHVRLKDCTVEAHGVEATYSAYRLHNSDPTNPDTGCFWTVLEDCTVRKRDGADVGDIPIGIAIIGAANATTIRGGSFGAVCTQDVYITHEVGETYIANAVLIDGVSFEGGTDAITVSGAPAAGISGLRIVNCRCEDYDTFLSLDGATVDGAVPPFLAGNYLTPDVATYISNTNNLRYVSLDSSNNAANGWNLDIGGAIEVQNTSGAGECLVAQASASSTGIVSFRNSAGTLIGKVRQGTSLTTLRIQAQTVEDIELIDVRGISIGNTAAQNLRGSVTLAAGTANVVFSRNEADANYYISLGGNANETFRWGSKANGGFTITSSNAGSTAVVDWLIIR